jgi:hypothetical protein
MVDFGVERHTLVTKGSHIFFIGIQQQVYSSSKLGHTSAGRGHEG